jgi:hypothetical protein
MKTVLLSFAALGLATSALAQEAAPMADKASDAGAQAVSQTVVMVDGETIDVDTNINTDIPDGITAPASETIVMVDGETITVTSAQSTDQQVNVIRKRLETNVALSGPISTESLNAQQANALINSQTPVTFTETDNTSPRVPSDPVIMVKIMQGGQYGAQSVDVESSNTSVTETVTPDGTTRMIRIEPTDGSETTLITITRN